MCFLVNLWAVAQLKELPTPITVAELTRDLTTRWPQLQFKLPAVKHDVLDRDNPLSSYLFLRPPVPPRLDTSPFVQRLLRDPGSHKIQYVTDSELAGMSPTPLLPDPGQIVRVTAGDWADMEGVIVEKNCETVDVLIELWSRKSVVTLRANEFVEA